MGAAPRTQRGPVGLGGMARWPRLRMIVARDEAEPVGEGDEPAASDVGPHGTTG
jgi:hypothetical protein